MTVQAAELTASLAHALKQKYNQSYQEVVLVNVVWTCKLRFLADSLTEDHNLLKEEARERFDLGRGIGLTRRKSVQGVQRTFMQEFTLGGNFAFEALKREKHSFKHCCVNPIFSIIFLDSSDSRLIQTQCGNLLSFCTFRISENNFVR